MLGKQRIQMPHDSEIIPKPEMQSQFVSKRTAVSSFCSLSCTPLQTAEHIDQPVQGITKFFLCIRKGLFMP